MTKLIAPIQLMTRAVQIVVFVFVAFGGFVLNVSPPDYSNSLPLANGLVQFGALVILLAAAAAVRSFLVKEKRIVSKAVRTWFLITLLFAVGFIIMGMIYYNHITDYTIYHGKWEKTFIRGTSLTLKSNEICTEENKAGFEDCEHYLFTDFYNSDEIAFSNLLWKAGEVNDRKKILFRDYILMILFLCCALFSLVEYLNFRFADLWVTEK